RSGYSQYGSACAHELSAGETILVRHSAAPSNLRHAGQPDSTPARHNVHGNLEVGSRQSASRTGRAACAGSLWHSAAFSGTPARMNRYALAGLVLILTASVSAPASVEQLRVLEDKEEIRELLIAYGRDFDKRDFAAYAQLFAKDGVWTGGGSG